uniref:Uncharacterized protein n=1 Tax=Eptatretus burgeri TaxID=7764 RepID=A0A8C4QMG6_EPTBU
MFDGSEDRDEGSSFAILGVFIGTVTVFASLHAVRLLLAVRANLHLIATFPGPPSHWLFGHLLELHPQSQMLHKLYTWSLDYSGAHRIRFGIQFFSLTITNPSYIRTVLTLPGPKNKVDYQFIEPWIGQGLITLPPAPWYPRRRLLTPAFHYDILKDYAQLIAHSVYQLLDKWDQKVGPGAVFDVYEDLSLLTLDSLMRCAFSRPPRQSHEMCLQPPNPLSD